MLVNYYRTIIIPHMEMLVTKENISFENKKTGTTDHHPVLKLEVQKDRHTYRLKRDSRGEFTLILESKDGRIFCTSEGIDDYIGLVWLQKKAR